MGTGFFMEDPSNLEAVKALILKTFSFMENDYYYTHSSNIEDSRVFDECLIVEYENTITRRRLSVSYTTGDRFTFSITIERLPYNGKSDIISLGNYLRSVDKDFSIKPLNCFDLEAFEHLLIRLRKAIEAHALEIIDGKIWFETYYPRWD